jgi:hypothetical protein
LRAEPLKSVGRFWPLAGFNPVRTDARRQRIASPPGRSARHAARAAKVEPEAWSPMPQEARDRLERALCGVLERRYPGLRFAMKRELDAVGKRAAPSGDANRLKDAL